jgi:hypothetical protein
MIARDQPLHTGGKYQPDSERRGRIANGTDELIPNRQHRQFLLTGSCSERVSTASFIDISSVTGTAGEEVSFRAAGELRRILAA